LAVRIFQDLYQLTEAWPRQLFGLMMDVRRAAMGIPTNLGEGQYHGAEADQQEFVALAGQQLTTLQGLLQTAQAHPAIDGSSLTPVVAAATRLEQLLQDLGAPRG